MTPMPAYRHLMPDDIAHARTLYEETDVSPRDVARVLGIGTNTFYRRVKQWGWRRRRLRVAEVDALAREAAASRDARLATLGERVLDDRRSAMERAEAAVYAQLAALEAMRERVMAAAYTVLDGERSGRTAQSLVKALAEIRRYREEERSRAVASVEEEDSPEERERLISELRAQFDRWRERPEDYGLDPAPREP